jgi:hypothetical protein
MNDSYISSCDSFNSSVRVTRLIRIAYGDYQLQTIPPGLAIEVPVKPVLKQRNRGPLFVTATRNTPASNRKGRRL